MALLTLGRKLLGSLLPATAAAQLLTPKDPNQALRLEKTMFKVKRIWPFFEVTLHLLPPLRLQLFSERSVPAWMSFMLCVA
jgi:hypothetical protein